MRVTGASGVAHSIVEYGTVQQGAAGDSCRQLFNRFIHSRWRSRTRRRQRDGDCYLSPQVKSTPNCRSGSLRQTATPMWVTDNKYIGRTETIALPAYNVRRVPPLRHTSRSRSTWPWNELIF